MRVGVDQVAAEVGYESVAAFRKQIGLRSAARRYRETSSGAVLAVQVRTCYPPDADPASSDRLRWPAR